MLKESAYTICRRFLTNTIMKQFECRENIIKQFLKSVAAVDPAKLIAENLKIVDEKLYVCDKVYNIKSRNIYLVGFGKAVFGMAAQCEKILGERLKKGVISVPDNMKSQFQGISEFSLKPNSVIRVCEGAKNNLPDADAEKAADEIIQLVKSLDKANDYLIVLISGGGSALFPKPKHGITLDEKLKTILLLTSSGANIAELNSVRKRLSAVKGGGLACLSYPVKTITLILSDVIGDPLDVIASGPTVPNSDRETEASSIIQKYNLKDKLSNNVLNVIKEVSSEFKVPSEVSTFPHVDNFIIGNNTRALNAGKQYADAIGFQTVILSRKIKGSIENVSNFYIHMLFEILNCLENKDKYYVISNENLLKGCCFDIEDNFIPEINEVIKDFSVKKQMCIIGGGEITLKLKGDGKGGRNQELALLISIKIHELKTKFPNLFDKYDVTFLIAGTDGVDGPTNAAGAIGEANVVEEAKKVDLNVNEFLMKNDSYNFFEKIVGGSYLIKIGHTGTNVMDIHSFIIYEKS